MDLAALPLEELEHIQQAVGEEISRRITAQNAPGEIDRITRRALTAHGISEGSQLEPAPAGVGYPLGWRTAHNGHTWTSDAPNNVWEPGVHDTWTRKD